MSVTHPAAPARSARRQRPTLAVEGSLRRFIEGDLASLRVVVELAVIWAIFQIANSNFLTAVNLTNLALQITGTALISIGVVLVLLLGEIDLSVGAVSGFAAGLMAVLSVNHGWAPVPAIAAGDRDRRGHRAAAGAARDPVRHPVVHHHARRTGRVAGSAAAGARLDGNGQSDQPDDRRARQHLLLDGCELDHRGVAIAAYAGTSIVGHVRRVRAGLPGVGIARVAIRVALVAAVGIVATAVFTSDRGMPLPVVILVAFVAFFQYLATRTRFGRHIYAVGGSDGPIPHLGEAARRAGIHVTRVRVTVFVLAGTMAAIGGIVEASRLLAVTQSSGGSDLLLFAIAGPVIAGTSLFGGRGSVWSALLGALVIGSISNGMDLLALPSAVKFMVTGGVLAVAVIVDALARRQRQRTGRR